MQSKLHLLQHDKGFLQSNLKYLIELGNKLSQYAEDARAEASTKAEAHAAEVERRKRIISLRASLADSRTQNETRNNKSIGLGHQISDLKVSLSYSDGPSLKFSLCQSDKVLSQNSRHDIA